MVDAIQMPLFSELEDLDEANILDVTPEPGSLIIVWFSCGAASAVAAKKTIEKYSSTCEIRIVNNPVKEEDEDNRRFLRDVEKWLGRKIEIAINRNWPNCSTVEVWEKRGYMANKDGAPCTQQLKREARFQYESSLQFEEHRHGRKRKIYMVLGYTADEMRRAKDFATYERGNFVPVLIHEKLTKNDCFKILLSAGLTLPKAYTLGLPNGNCIGCVKATSPTYWNLIRKVFPDVFQARAELSRRLGARLVRVKGQRQFLDELDPEAVGRALDSLDLVGMECGIFCPTFPEANE